jgi:hypothetical protein
MVDMPHSVKRRAARKGSALKRFRNNLLTKRAREGILFVSARGSGHPSARVQGVSFFLFLLANHWIRSFRPNKNLEKFGGADLSPMWNGPSFITMRLRRHPWRADDG